MFPGCVWRGSPCVELWVGRSRKRGYWVPGAAASPAHEPGAQQLPEGEHSLPPLRTSDLVRGTGAYQWPPLPGQSCEAGAVVPGCLVRTCWACGCQALRGGGGGEAGGIQEELRPCTGGTMSCVAWPRLPTSPPAGLRGALDLVAAFLLALRSYISSLVFQGEVGGGVCGLSQRCRPWGRRPFWAAEESVVWNSGPSLPAMHLHALGEIIRPQAIYL